MGKVVRYTRRPGKLAPKPSLRAGGGACTRALLLAAVIGGSAAGYLAYDLTTPAAPAPFLGFVSPAASSEPIAGRASVIDGDTLEIHGTRIRLHGIDAPEGGQACAVQKEKSRCGQTAALALAEKIGEAIVRCEARDIDRYNRIVAVCQARGEDLNGWMVASGWALAYRDYSSAYVAEEEAAAAARLGVWQGDFVPPWDWRRRHRLLAEADPAEPSADCKIKGNISLRSGERIYHVPGGEHYARTRIDTAKGERWFCSEAAARAAGWRLAGGRHACYAGRVTGFSSGTPAVDKPLLQKKRRVLPPDDKEVERCLLPTCTAPRPSAPTAKVPTPSPPTACPPTAL